MTNSRGSTVSARDRARKANAQRLADELNRLHAQEADLISYFDATRDEDRIEDDLARKIARLRGDATSRLSIARQRRAVALAALKDRGETYSSVSALVELPIAEVTKLVRSGKVGARSNEEDRAAAEVSDNEHPLPARDVRATPADDSTDVASTATSTSPEIRGVA